MLKKMIVMIYLLSNLSAATVGGNQDGKIYDKIFLDIFLDNGEVDYQYLPYTGSSFNMQDRKLHSSFYKYEARKLKKAKFIATGKLKVPKDSKEKIIFISKGAYKATGVIFNNWAGAKGCLVNKDFRTLSFNSLEGGFGRDCGYGWQLYINGKAITKERTQVEIKNDSMGNKFLDLKIEGISHNAHALKNALSYLNIIKKGVSSISFFAEVNQQAGRGQKATKQKVGLRPYVIEE